MTTVYHLMYKRLDMRRWRTAVEWKLAVEDRAEDRLEREQPAHLLSQAVNLHTTFQFVAWFPDCQLLNLNPNVSVTISLERVGNIASFLHFPIPHAPHRREAPSPP